MGNTESIGSSKTETTDNKSLVVNMCTVFFYSNGQTVSDKYSMSRMRRPLASRSGANARPTGCTQPAYGPAEARAVGHPSSHAIAAYFHRTCRVWLSKLPMPVRATRILRRPHSLLRDVDCLCLA